MKQALFALSIFCYPLFVYFGLKILEPQYIAVLFALLFLVRHLVAPKDSKHIPHLNLVVFFVTVLFAVSAVTNSSIVLKFYPVLMSGSFLLIFGYSLWRPPSVVQVIASLHETLDEKGIIYTRNVTKIWCVFFLLNMMTATWTIYQANPKIWLIYNGFLSYVVMGLLMAGEWLVRKKIKNNNQ